MVVSSGTVEGSKGSLGKAEAEGFEPAYLALLRSGALAERVRQADRHLEDCDLCARYCHVDRRGSLRGVVCRTGERAVINSYGAHLGE